MSHPRFASETWRQAAARVPALAALAATLPPHEGLADVAALVDTRPGWRLVGVTVLPGAAPQFLYREKFIARLARWLRFSR